jgi:hypothetical protein
LLTFKPGFGIFLAQDFEEQHPKSNVHGEYQIIFTFVWLATLKVPAMNDY